MADITTLYAKSIRLSSPIIVASSGLTHRFDKIKEFADAGAGAIVLKSVFEEQLEAEIDQMSGGSDYPEAAEYLAHYVKSHALSDHIALIERCKAELQVPIIASINCYKADSWLSYAQQLVEAGAAALELNVMRIDTRISQEWGEPEQQLVDLVKAVKTVMPKVPLTLKLSRHYTNIVKLARDLHLAGADGVVLFNRSYMPDIDIDKEVITSGAVFSEASDFSESLRYAALVHGGVGDLGLGLSTGARNGKDLIKGILAGADAVQYCTALYKEGAKLITEMNEYLQHWMEKKQYHSVKEFRGRLAATRVDHANLYERSQFMKYYASEDPTPVDVLDTSLPHKGHKLEY